MLYCKICDVTLGMWEGFRNVTSCDKDGGGLKTKQTRVT